MISTIPLGAVVAPIVSAIGVTILYHVYYPTLGEFALRGTAE
jgi:hypothetical protein